MLRNVGIRLFPVVLDLDLQCRVADAHHTFRRVRYISNTELERLHVGTTDVKSVGHVVSRCTGRVRVADIEFAVNVLVGRGLVRTVRSGYGTRELAEVGVDVVSLHAQIGSCRIRPEIAAPGVDVKAEALRRSADGDVGKVKTSLLHARQTDRRQARSREVHTSKLSSVSEIVFDDCRLRN